MSSPTKERLTEEMDFIGQQFAGHILTDIERQQGLYIEEMSKEKVLFYLNNYFIQLDNAIREYEQAHGETTELSFANYTDTMIQGQRTFKRLVEEMLDKAQTLS